MKITPPQPLAADNGWRLNQEAVREAIAERRAYASSLVETFGEDYAGATAKDVEALRRVNDEIESLESSLVSTRWLPQPRGTSRPTGRSPHSGQLSNTGAEVMRRLTLNAAFDGTSGGTAAPSFFVRELRDMPQRRLFLRDLIPTLPVTSDKVDYVRQTVNTHAAAAVAAGAQKPKSTYTIERVTATIATIAHMSEAIDRHLLADYDQAVNFINDVLVVGVLLEEEDQLLNGDGTAPNLRGILQTVGIQTQAKGTDPTFDAVFKAITKCRLQNFEPDAVVMHPNDWQELRLTRTAEGVYIQGAPVEAGNERLFDKPVVVSPLIAEGTGLVGAFGEGATVYDREQARVSFTETGLGDVAGQELFDRNQLRFRGESRIGLAVTFPLAFTSVTGI